MRIILYFMLLISVCNVFGQTTNTDVIAKIKTQKVDDIISIIATASNTTEVYKTLKYSILVNKTGITTGNVSKNKQEGRFTLEANETKELAKTSLNTNEKDKIVILMLIYDEDEIIAKDRIVFNEDKIQEEEPVKNKDGIELTGIVIEETKTKPGRDFYETFYNKYTFNNINGKRIVGVYEKLSFGRSTIIQVKIDDNVVHEFIGKPDLEYLEQMAKLALRKVYKYFKDLEKQENNIKQY